MITLTSETSSSEHRLKTKLQAKFNISNQIFEQEEELTDFNVKQNQELK